MTSSMSDFYVIVLFCGSPRNVGTFDFLQEYVFWQVLPIYNDQSVINYVLLIHAPVKLFCPHPPPRATPENHFFGGCPGLFITSFLPCPALINHFNLLILECPPSFHFLFQCPALFYHTIIFPMTLVTL